MSGAAVSARAPDLRLAQALLDEVRRTLAVFQAPTTLTAEELLPLFAEQLTALTDVQELRHLFSIARQRATTYAPTPGEVREVWLELRRRRSHAPQRPADLPASPRFDEAEHWLAANPWAASAVECEVDHLTRTWPAELDEERARMLPMARLLVFNRLSWCAVTPAAPVSPEGPDAITDMMRARPPWDHGDACPDSTDGPGALT